MNGVVELYVWLEDALELTVSAGACATLLAVVVLAINMLFRRWLSARQMGLLWSLVLLRLLLPAAPTSPLSLQNLLPLLHDEVDGTTGAIAPAGVRYGVAQDPQPHSVTAASPPYMDLPDAAPASDIVLFVDWLAFMLPLIWLLGALAVLLRTTIVHWRFSRRVKEVVPTHDKQLLSVWTSCCRTAGTREGIPVVLFDGVDQPAVTGLFRPTLLLPEHVQELDEQQLRMVMLHELAHVRRRHIAANWLLVVIRAVHWWNPVYWLAAARYRSLREQACDAFALQRIEGLPPRRYGELLLTLASRPGPGAWHIKLPASILGFLSSFFRKRAVQNRLKALRTAGVMRGRWHTAAVAAVVVLAVASGFTDAESADAPVEHRYAQQAQVNLDWRDWQAVPDGDREPPVTRVYDIESAMARITADEPSVDTAVLMLKSILTHAVRHIEGCSQPPTDGVQTASEGLSERVVVDGNTLTVTAAPKAHTEIERYLQAWQQSGLAQICVETRLITSARDLASAAGISWKYLEAYSTERADEPPLEVASGKPVVRAKSAVEDYLPLTVASLSEEQTTALLQTAQDAVLFIHAPKVTLFNGQRATILDRTQTPFVVGIRDEEGPFVVGISEEKAGAGQPKIVVIDEGTKLTLRTVLSPDAASVRLEAGVELSQISDVETVSTFFRGESKTIQIPRVKRCRIDVVSQVPDGQSLLIGCIPSYEQKEFFYVLLTVRNLQLPADGGD